MEYLSSFVVYIDSNNINGLFLFFIAEIGKVRGNLFQINGKKADPLVLPDGSGPPVTLSEKVYVPIKDYPEVITVFENGEKRLKLHLKKKNEY